MTETIDTKLKPKDFLRTLGEQEKMTLELNEILYDGNWNEMLKELEEGKKQRNYSQKYHQRIARDIAAVKRIQDYEKAKNVALTYDL